MPETDAARDQLAEENKDGERVVSIRHRARPLIELLETALKENTAVLWEQGFTPAANRLKTDYFCFQTPPSR